MSELELISQLREMNKKLDLLILMERKLIERTLLEEEPSGEDIQEIEEEGGEFISKEEFVKKMYE